MISFEIKCLKNNDRQLMKEPARPHFVSTSGIYGGPDTEKIVDLVLSLNRLFKKHCISPYSEKLTRISFFFEVGGMIHDFNRFGIKETRIYKDMFSVSISIPASEHRDKSDDEIKSLIFDLVTSGIERAAKRLRKEKEVSFDTDSFIRDIGAAITEFYFNDQELQPSQVSLQIRQAFIRIIEQRRLASALGEPLPITCYRKVGAWRSIRMTRPTFFSKGRLTQRAMPREEPFG